MFQHSCMNATDFRYPSDGRQFDVGGVPRPSKSLLLEIFTDWTWRGGAAQTDISNCADVCPEMILRWIASCGEAGGEMGELRMWYLSVGALRGHGSSGVDD